LKDYQSGESEDEEDEVLDVIINQRALLSKMEDGGGKSAIG
jgi:hypothetical protein